MAEQALSLYSWNVNGLRAAEKKGFSSWLAECQPDLLGLQEVRAGQDQLPESVAEPEGYKTHFVAAERKGYSGVALYSKLEAEFEPLLIDEQAPWGSQAKFVRAPSESFDIEGRLQRAAVGELLVVNGYFPNGNGKERDNSRVPYKLDFYERLRAALEADFQAGRPILVMGDWNTAHCAVDLARPKQNIKTSGFLPEECEVMDRWMQAGWVDTFRVFTPAPDPTASVKESKKKGQAPVTIFPEGGGHYTWWSQRAGVRAKNIGWRIDYILASPGAVPFLKSAQIHPDVLGSDHCPISVTLDRAVLTAEWKK